MPTPRARLAALPAAVILALTVAGCGSDDGGSSAAPATSSSAASSAASSAPSSSSTASSSASSSASSDSTGTTVTASEGDFTITLSESQLSAGTYTFEVTNDGKATHSLTIEGPGGVDQTSDTLQGGQSTTMTVTLQAGTYEVYCPIGNHRSMGMDTTLTVS